MTLKRKAKGNQGTGLGKEVIVINSHEVAAGLVQEDPLLIVAVVVLQNILKKKVIRF